MTKRTLASGAILLPLLISGLALAQPVIVVLDHGAAPRQELRYHYAEGATDALMSMAAELAPQPGLALSVPPIVVPMTIETTEVLPDGSARYAVRMAGPVLDDSTAPGAIAMNQMIGSMLGQVGGTTTWGWVDVRGQILDSGAGEYPVSGELGTLPDDKAQAAGILGGLQDQMQQMSAPFPAEAVGLGARWQQTSSINVDGVSAIQISDYTLLARDGDTLELGVSITQTVDRQSDFAGEGLYGVSTLEAEAAGTVLVDLNSTVPYSEMTQSFSVPNGWGMKLTISIQPN